MKSALGIALLSIITCVVGSLYWWSGREDTPRFRTLPVERNDLLISISATGTIEPEEVIDVGAQIVGRIKSFGPDGQSEGKTIDYGSRVKEGDILAQLDDSQLTAELEKAKANRRLAEAELDRSQARHAPDRAEFPTAEALRDTDSESQYEMALAEREMAQAEVAVAEARLEQSKIALQQAEISLSYATIRAPIDGLLIDRRVNVGQTVVAGLNAPSLFLLARNLDGMRIWAAVNEADIGEIHVGQRATFRVDAFREKTFEGQVSQIRLNAAMSNNVVTYGVMVDIDNTEGKLLPYMTANIEFDVARRPNATLVPNQALRWRPTLGQVSPAVRENLAKMRAVAASSLKDEVRLAKPAVWVPADDGFARPIEVSLGLSDGTVTEIVEGDLKPGMSLIVGTIREDEIDFVSSFVSRVIE